MPVMSHEHSTASVEQQLRIRARQQEVVAQLGQMALTSTDLDDLFERAANDVSVTLGNEFVKIMELLPGGERLLVRAGVGWRPGIVGHLVLAVDHDTQAGYALRCKQPVVVRDLRTDERFRSIKLLREHGVISGMSVIISGKASAFGVLGTHTRDEREFTRDDVNFLQAVANVLAAAVERRKAEMELLHQQQQLSIAQQVTGVAIWEWDLASETLEWAPGSAEVYGVPFSELSTIEAWTNAVHPDDRERVQRDVRRCLDAEADYDGEFRTVWADGSTRWLVSRGRVLRGPNGRAERMIGVNMDITTRKRSEELMQRSEKLAMVGRLAATIAHEINNPLEAVSNLLYLIEHRSAIDDSGREWARMATQELERVTQIARQTLGFSRESVRPAGVDLGEMVGSVLRLYERRFSAKHVKVLHKFEPVPEVQAFSGEIRQVISNLLMNALDAVAEGGTIRVHVKPGLEFGAERRGVRIIVSDNGNGIPPENRRKIFEPFFTTKGEKGTGLGLWVTHGIVQKHGGTIRVFSSVGPERHGTTFSVFLPETLPTREENGETKAA